MKLNYGQGILVRNEKEANFIWKKLLLLGYDWNCSFSKGFRYYNELPIVIHIRHNKTLTYSNYYNDQYDYTIDNFKHPNFLDLE